MFAGVPLKSINYVLRIDSEGNFDASHWFGEKPALKEQNPLMNLPYVIANGQLVSQSNACFLHLGRVLGLLGNDESDLISCEQLLCEIMDLRNSMGGSAYSPTIAHTDAAKLLGNAAGKNGSFQKFELWLAREKSAGRSGLFLVADKATAPDFHLWEMLDQFTLYASRFEQPDPLLAFPHLQAFYASFRTLPQNARYFDSVLARLPMNNKSASFGSTPSGAQWVTGVSVDEFEASSGIY